MPDALAAMNDGRGSWPRDGERWMREGFEEFLGLDDSYWKRLSSNGTYAFDTNVLFDFYRYTEATRNEMFEAVAALGDRGWVPHQVAYEFHSGQGDLARATGIDQPTLSKMIRGLRPR
jgi:PIN like domain